MTGRDHPVLQAEGVAKSYGGRKILENVSTPLGYHPTLEHIVLA